MDVFHFQFISSKQQVVDAYTAYYDWGLVLLSVVVAVVGAHTTYLFSQQETTDSQLQRTIRSMAGAVAMGSGIWGMHFLGMLAYRVPVETRFDTLSTIISVIPAVLAGLIVLKGNFNGYLDLIARSTAMGVCIGLMHYIGMSAMIMDALMFYSMTIFGLSIIVAVVLSAFSLWIKKHFSVQADGQSIRNTTAATLGASVLMGSAISGMHYTGMASLYVVQGQVISTTQQGLSAGDIGYIVTLVMLSILTLLILSWFITQRIELTRKIESSQKKLQSVFDSTSDAILVTNEGGEILSFNKAAGILLGITRESTAAHHIRTFLDYDESKYLAQANEHGTGDIDIRDEATGKNLAGQQFPVELSVNSSDLPDIRQLIFTLRDITSRKESEKELEGHRDHLEELVKHATSEINALVTAAISAVITIDEKGIIQLFNPAAEQMFGWKSDEVSGKNIAMLIPGMDETRHDDYIRQFIQGKSSNLVGQSRELKGLRRDGLVFPIQISVGHSQLDGDRHLFVAFITDITEQKKAEKELISARDNAEEAARVKANFLANMSHEIRTPMNAVIGFSEILLQDRGLSESSYEHVNTILSSGKNLLNIINDILDFSKIESGSISIEHVCFHLENVIKDCMKTLEFKAMEKSLKMSFQMLPGLPVRVMGDPTRLRQVIINLLGNAIKFTSQGEVRLKVEAVDNASLVQFSIIDTGIGMSAAQVSKVFDAFAQADTSTNRRFGGTGLGTTISKQIVELMGGTIWVESREGEGSTFRFTADLPEAVDARDCLFEDGSYVESTYHSPRGFNVLLAEDIAANATLAVMRLEQQGHRVTWVKNGREAVDAVLANDFDIVLMDIQMPELDGMAATAEIREKRNPEKDHLPIVALTASVMKEDQKLCTEAGMDIVIGKPIDFPRLFAAMESIVPEGKGVTNANVLPVGDIQHGSIDFSPVSELVDYVKAVDVWIDEKLYANALIEFVHDRKHSGSEILGLVQNDDDLKKAGLISHAVKGLAGNLYITEVEMLAARLDNLLKQGEREQISSVSAELQVALDALAIGVSKLSVDGLDDEIEARMDANRAGELIEEVIQALDEISPDAVEPYMKELLHYLPKTALAPIQRCIDNFEFDGAKVEAKKVLAQFVQDSEQVN